MTHPASTAQQWAPYPGPQTRFLTSTADEALIGGMAGPGKTDCLLMGALRFVHVPGYQGIIFRRYLKDVKRELWRRAMKWYPGVGGKPNKSDHSFTWNDGQSIIRFGGMENEDDKYRYKSDEFQYIAFDELSEFTQSQYTYLFSRIRSTLRFEGKRLPCLLRAGTNPGSEWILRRFAPWVYYGHDDDEDYDGPRVPNGQPVWVRPDHDNDGEEFRTDRPEPGDRDWTSRVFFPANRADNVALQQGDPHYEARLNQLDRIERARLKDGDWFANYVAGSMFLRKWWYYDDGQRRPGRIIDRIPCEIVKWVRYWDRAGTEEEIGKDPDYTAGAQVGLGADGRLYVADMQHFREEPPGVERRIKETADTDAERYDIEQWLERDPAQAGKAEISHYKRHILCAHNMRSWAPTGSKVTRAKPLSSDAEHGLLIFVNGPWVRGTIKELVGFPGTKTSKKDRVDALSGAKRVLMPHQLKLLKRLRKGGSSPAGNGAARRVGHGAPTVGGF